MYTRTRQQASEQKKRWEELAEKMQSNGRQISGDQMLPKTDFGGLNFDDLLGACLS